MSAPEVVERARQIPAIKMPATVQLLYVKAPPNSLLSIHAQMLALEKGYPAGGGKLVVTFARGVPPRGELPRWTHTHLEAFPPIETLRAS